MIRETRAIRGVEVEPYVDPGADWQTTFWLQYSTLARRNFARQTGRYFSVLLYGQALFLSFYIGLVWINQERTEETSRDRLGMVAWSIITNTKLYFQCQGRPQADARDARASSKFRPQFNFLNWILNFPDFSASPQLQSLLASTFCNNWSSHLVVIDVILSFM